MSNDLRNVNRDEDLLERSNESDNESDSHTVTESNESNDSIRTVLLDTHLRVSYSMEMPRLTYSDIVQGVDRLQIRRNVRDLVSRRIVRSRSEESMPGFVRTIHHTQSLPTISESHESLSSLDSDCERPRLRGVHTMTGSSAGESDASAGSPRLMDRGDPPVDVGHGGVVRRRSHSLPRDNIQPGRAIPDAGDDSPPSRPGSA